MNRREFIITPFLVTGGILLADGTQPKKKLAELPTKHTPVTKLYINETTKDYVLTTEIQGKTYKLPISHDIREEVFQSYGKFIEEYVNIIANQANNTQNEIVDDVIRPNDAEPTGIIVDFWVVDSDDHTIFLLMDKEGNPLFDTIISMTLYNPPKRYPGEIWRPVFLDAKHPGVDKFGRKARQIFKKPVRLPELYEIV